MNENKLLEFATESNKIEGIYGMREAQLHAKALKKLLAEPEIHTIHLTNFVQTIQPNARLRAIKGLNVSVGEHYPPPGGPKIVEALNYLLLQIHRGGRVFSNHLAYESLHPFTDGNGRSGRVLWLHQMLREGWHMQLPFLHQFYYQSLDYYRVSD